MDYRIVFDLQTSEIRFSNYLYVLPGTFLFVLGIVAFLFRNRLSNPFRARPMPRQLPFFLVLFGALWMQLSFFSLYIQYHALETAMKSGKVNVAEGRVMHFTPSSYLGSKGERFCVSDSDVCFSYSDYIVTPGFNQTQSHGGPIKDGLPVKVTYKDDTIVKLEVAPASSIYSKKHNPDAPPPEASMSPAR